MTSLPKNFPFYASLPKPLGILFLILLFIPIMTVSGAYSVNSSEMMGGLGFLSEHISFIGFMTSIGMAAFSPFFYSLVCIRREKMMCLVGFSILAILSYVCAETDNLFLLALCSLIMGFVRQTLLMCNLFTLIKYAFGIEATNNITPGNEPTEEAGWDRLDTEKTSSMPTIYFFFMLLGQLGTWITAWCAYHYEWQLVYYIMMGAMLVAVLIIFFTMPSHPYPSRHIPLSFSKFGNVTVFCLMCSSFIYIMVYGKVLDWYDDPTIRYATLICLLSTAFFFYLEKTRRSPYFLLDAFKSRSIQGGILLFFGLMILNSSQMFVNVFVSIGMQTENIQNAMLGNWVVPGYFLGLVIALFGGAKGIHLKWLFALGFLLIGAASLFMYFEVQTAGLLDRMKWPVIIRATGMMLLYSLTAVYANQRMPYKLLSTWVCIMLTVRMIIAPGIGSALYSNVLQYRQQYYITRYAHDYNRTATEIAQQYDGTARGMQIQGKSETEAQIIAAMSTKGKVQVQATLSAIKEMAGWTLYGCLICCAIVLLVRWPKRDISQDTKEELMRIP